MEGKALLENQRGRELKSEWIGRDDEPSICGRKYIASMSYLRQAKSDSDLDKRYWKEEEVEMSCQ